MKGMIKWTVSKETEFPILVGEFQAAAKYDFTSRVGKKKIENVKDELSEDFIKMLKGLVGDE